MSKNRKKIPRHKMVRGKNGNRKRQLKQGQRKIGQWDNWATGKLGNEKNAS